MQSSLPSRLILALVIGPSLAIALSVFSLSAQEVSPPGEPEIIFPTPTCRAGITQFDASIGQLGTLGDLQSIRTALQQAIASDDPQLGQYLRERLTELIGQDSARALEVIGWAENTHGIELGIYMQAVKDSAAVRDPQVVERLLTMAERHADTQHAVAALDALETQPSLTPAQLDRLATLGKDKAGGPAAKAAVLAIGKVMENDLERFEEYVARLLDIAESQVHEDVVALALEMSGTYTQPMFGDVSRQRLANFILHHPSKNVRIGAALVISTARDTEAVLKVYRQAFRESNDLCLRWNMLKFSVRAAGAKALPLIEEFAALDPRFQKDQLDFKDIFASGIVDWEHVWLAKNAQGEHPCDLAP